MNNCVNTLRAMAQRLATRHTQRVARPCDVLIEKTRHGGRNTTHHATPCRALAVLIYIVLLATTDDNTCALHPQTLLQDTVSRRAIAPCMLSSRWLMVCACVCTGHERTCTRGREKPHMLCKRASQSVSCTRGVPNQLHASARTLVFNY